MNLTALSPVAALLVCAAAAFVVSDLATTLLHVRYYSGRWAVTRWLATGLAWHREEQLKRTAWSEVLLDALMPWRILRAVEALLMKEPAKQPDKESATQPDKELEKESAVEALLVRLACRDKSALYRMAPDLIAAQINGAANVALDCPKTHLPLLFAMAGQLVDKRVVELIKAVENENSEKLELRSVAAAADLETVLLEYGRIAMFREMLERKESKAQLLELRSRIETAIQQRIDAFQTSARAAAQLRDQVMYAAAAVLVISLLNGWTFLGRPGRWLPGALVAAFLAPYFGDLRTFLRQSR